MNQLCFITNLTSSDMAAWVHTIGTIIAILAAVGVAWWQRRSDIKEASDKKAVDCLRQRLLLMPVFMELRSKTTALEHMTKRRYEQRIPAIDLRLDGIDQLEKHVPHVDALPHKVMKNFLDLVGWGQQYNSTLYRVMFNSSSGVQLLTKKAVEEGRLVTIRRLREMADELYSWAHFDQFGEKPAPLEITD